MTETEKDEILLTQIALMFQTAALQQMGKLKNPMTDSVQRDLGQARISIDILDVLHRRMKGNLTDSEERMYANVLRELRLNFVDEDGKSVWPAPIEMSVEVVVPDETIFLSRNFIVNIQKLKFEKEGLYSIDIAVDGRQEGSIPLLVKVPPPAPQGH